MILEKYIKQHQKVNKISIQLLTELRSIRKNINIRLDDIEEQFREPEGKDN